LDKYYKTDAPDYSSAKVEANDILDAFTKIEAARNNVVNNDNDKQNVGTFDNEVFKKLGVSNKEGFDDFKRNIKNIQEECQSKTTGVKTGFEEFRED